MRILNNSKSYTPGASKEYYDVPSTDSHEYRTARQSEYELRIWQEISDYVEAGGLAVFASLTYRDSSLPMFYYRDGQRNYAIPCFSAADKTKFMQDIRNYLDRNYGLRGPCTGQPVKMNQYGKEVRYMSMSLRYVWTCEYGMSDEYVDDYGDIRKGTFRPHYHPIFLLPPELKELNEFKDEESTKRFFQSMWPHGMIRWSKSEAGGIFVKSPFAAVYVSKYCFKDGDWFAQPQVREFLYDEQGKIIKERKELMKGKLPTHWQSHHFGENLKKLYDNIDALRDGVDFKFTGILKTGVTTKHPCPRYIKRKIMYYHDEKGRYHINDVGIQYQMELYPDKVEKLAAKFSKDSSIKQLVRTIPDELCEKITGKHSVHSVQKYIFDLLDGRSWYELAIYSLVWRGLYELIPSKKLVDDYYEWQIVNCQPSVFRYKMIDKLSWPDFLDISKEQYMLNLLSDRNSVVSTLSDKGFVREIDEVKYYFLRYDNLERFRGFDQLLLFMNKIRSEFLERSHQGYIDRMKERKRTRYKVS